MFFNSIKEINRLRKKINRLSSKGISNIYFKVTIEMFSKLLFSWFKKFDTSQFFGGSNSCRYHWILKLLVATYRSEVWEQNFVWFFYYFNFERNYDVSKPKSPCILLNKTINFSKNETESKMENPLHSFRKTNLVLQLIQ